MQHFLMSGDDADCDLRFAAYAPCFANAAALRYRKQAVIPTSSVGTIAGLTLETAQVRFKAFESKDSNTNLLKE